MNRLLKHVEHALRQHPSGGECWLGFSGGLDSTVLLYLLCELGVEVRVVHVHHGLSPNADAWLAHCAETAESLGVPFTARRVRVNAKEGGLERAAREARYRVFGELLQPGDTLLLAQHGDDQVETFFLRLLRGAGALGLAAMATSRPLGGAAVLRPLLGTSRAELASYARERKLRWIEDESNSDQTLDRNYLRQVVLPLLRERWPVRERVTRAADNLREAVELLRDLGRGDLELCDRRRESFGESLDLEMLRRLPRRRQKNLLRCWLADSGGDMPEAPHLRQALDQALQAGADRCIAVGLGGRVVRRHRNRLYLTPPLGRRPDGEWHWRGASALQLPGGWELRARSGWPQGDYTVRFRRGGERARPVGRRHSQTLKKLLQEVALEPWLRDWIPLVYCGERLIAVGGLLHCDAGIAGSLEWCYLGPDSGLPSVPPALAD